MLMPKNRDLQSLLDIEQAAQKTIEFKASLDKETFLTDEKTQSAIVFQLLIIGCETI
jgi:uncharacterized protein with HEPN domain